MLVADIERLVRCESPSADLAAVARSAAVVAELGAERLGAAAEVIGDKHVCWRFGVRPRVLLLGHHDTVWPLGSLATHPFAVRDGVLTGPGCFDMKAGVAMIFHALAELDDLDGITVLITGDEELGSPSSRTLIEDVARGCAAALVLEASGPGGALKNARKGVSRYDVQVRGRAAHAGLEPERGVNATIEAAHQVQAVAALAAGGTTVTPTRLESGTTVNTVPAAARFDVRVWDRLVRVARGMRHPERLEQVLPPTPVALLSTPAAASNTSPPAHTPTAIPGTACSAISSGNRSCNHF